jgi:teichoic acid transport system permease protein
MAAPTSTLRRAFPAFRRYVRDLWSRREFAWYLAMGNLKARNASTALGLLWWVLNPLLLGAVYGLVFGVLFPSDTRRGIPDFIPYLLAGMFPFYFTRSALTGGVTSIVSNSRLLANLHFPRMVLPLAALIESFVGFLASLSVFYLIVGTTDQVWPQHTIVWLVPIIVIHIVFNIGLSTLVARVAVPFRDLNNLVPYVIRLWLYLSPIIYPPSFIDNGPAWIGKALELNPLYPMLAMYRHALLGYEVDKSIMLSRSALAAVVMCVIGVTAFIRYEGKMAKYL